MPRQDSPRPNRRHFLQWTGVGAAAALVADRVLGGSKTKTKTKKSQPDLVVPPKPCRLELGLASFTTRDFTLDETLAMAARLGLKHVCLKSMHLPLDCHARPARRGGRKGEEAGA